MATVQPKKPQSAYWLWLAESREAIAKELGSGKGSDVAKAAGEKWKVLPEAQKAPYEKRAAELKATYDKEMEEFKSNGGVPAKRSRKPEKPEKKVKDAKAPKKPTAGGYGVFLAEKRDEIKKSLPSDHKITDVTKQAGAMWKALSEAQKKPYEDQFVEKMAAYKAAMEEYKKNGGQGQDEEEEEGEEEGEEKGKGEDEGEEEGEEEGEGAEEGEGEASPEKATKKSRGAAREAKQPKEPKEPKAKAAPKKRAAAEAKEEPASKRGRKGSTEKEEPSIDGRVLAAARRLGWEAELKNLASRPGVSASGKSAKEMLDALRSSNGLVNPARRALLGA